MSIAVLQQLGLSPNEAKIYNALIDLKEASVSEIALKTNIHRRNVYDSLNRLIEKGLIFPIISKSENNYSPVDPGKLKELVKEKEQLLESVLPDFEKRFLKNKNKQEAFIYRGIEGHKNYLRDILREGKDLYFIGGTLGLFDPRLDQSRKQFLTEIKRKGIKIHALFDHEIKENGLEEVKEFHSKAKFLPKGYSTESIIFIFGEYVVSHSGAYHKKLAEDVTIFVLHDKRLAESYRTWFKLIYDLLP